MYYGLENFYQNHREYYKSFNRDQFLGRIRNYDTNADKKKCDPFYKNGTGFVYFPCGSIANSMFNDVIRLKDVPLIRTGIAWKSDKDHKFKNPPNVNTPVGLKNLLKKFAKPNHWKKNLWELDMDDMSNNGLQNEDLIVWMRTAALPNFRKLYRKINHTANENYTNGLSKGGYELEIEYNFDVASFNGRKNIVLTTQSVLGGRNLLLGIAYIVVGGICIIFGIVFLFIHCTWGAKVPTEKL